MFKKIMKKILPDHRQEANSLEAQPLKRMVRGIVTAHPDEIGCDECFEKLDRFVEMTLAGKDASEAMPLVRDHLARCGNCREEFEALLHVLRTLA